MDIPTDSDGTRRWETDTAVDNHHPLAAYFLTRSSTSDDGIGQVLRASFLVNLLDLAYAAPARVCIASHAVENCSRDALDAGSLLHAALFADVLFALDGLVLGGSFGLGSNAVCADSTPQSQSPRSRGCSVGCSVWEAWGQLLQRGGLCTYYVGLDAMYGWPQRMGPGVGADTVAVVVVGGV